jgi:hypothetical protein
MDNLPAQKIAAVRDAAGSAQLFLLPPYSPDMNPIDDPVRRPAQTHSLIGECDLGGLHGLRRRKKMLLPQRQNDTGGRLPGLG